MVAVQQTHCLMGPLQLVRGTLIGFVIGIAAFAVPAGARQTDDLGHDVISALVAAEQFEDALWLCQFERERSGSDSLAYAKWTGRLAEVLAYQSVNELFAAKPDALPETLSESVSRVSRPIDQLLAHQIESDFALPLKAKRLLVRQRLVRAAIVITTVAPTPQSTVDDLLERISRLQRNTEELKGLARDEWSKRLSDGGSRRGSPSRLPASEFDRLVGELEASRIALALLQTELFPSGSTDYHAAAADAVTVAEQVLPSLSDQTPAKHAAQALYAEALLRSGDPERAARLIRDAFAVTSRSSGDVAKWTALAVRYQLARNDANTARQICEAYFRTGAATTASLEDRLEMEFAMLDVLLRSDADQQRLAAHLERLSEVGGSFARRRAEAIVIRELPPAGADGTDSPRPSGASPALIAAQGEDALRRKEPARAAALLGQAAMAEPNAEKAIAYATKGAASAMAANDPDAAIEMLRATSQKHAQTEAAPDLMMQAAILASQAVSAAGGQATQSIDRLDGLLAELSQTWPQTSTGFRASQWRCRILAAGGQAQQAAEAALEYLLLRKQADQLETTAALWYESAVDAAPQAVRERLSSFATALGELVADQPALRADVDRVAAWLLDPDTLDGRALDEATSSPSTRGLAAVLSFRQGGRTDLSCQEIDLAMCGKVRWRLQRDAMLLPRRRQVIGKVLKQWPDNSPWQQAVADYWAAPGEATIGAIKRFAIAAPADSETMTDAIDLLASSDDPMASRVAVELTDRIANRLKIGSDRWYQEKLRACRLLVALGDPQEAIKRAQYVLLARPPKDDVVRKAFESIVGSPNSTQ